MEAKHTPGPWKHNKKFTHYEKDVYSEIVAGIGFHLRKEYEKGEKGFSIVGCISDADAKLIATAPELLEAMQEFVDRVEKGEVRSTKTYNKFKELIEKATTL